MLILNTIFLILFCYLFFFNFYFLVFSIAGRFRKNLVGKSTSNGILGKFLILIPTYKEDFVILNSAKQAALHNYPKDKFDVYVIADQLQPETIEKLRQIPVNVLEVHFDQSTKAKSINKALEEVRGNYDFVFILDVDNVMGEDCLLKVNDTLNSGFLAVQAHRTAKNKNNSFAVLDGISEEINNHIFRKGHRALGLSSALIGSGMGFEYHYYKKRMHGIEEMGGEDREIELRILKDGNKIEYREDALVFDEKVQDASVFAKQRTRWLAGQFYFLKKHGKEGFIQLFKGNLDYFDKVLQTMIPPRVIMLGALPVMALLSWWFNLSPGYVSWLVLIAVMASAMFLAVPNQLYNKNLVKGLLQIPKAILFMVLGVLNIRTAHQTNFHTPHSPAADEETKGL